MKIIPADNAWILISTALVLLMAMIGLPAFYAGLTKAKSMLNTFVMVMVSFCLASLVWIIIGYSLVFGGDIGGIIGTLKYAFLNGINPSDPSPNADNLYHYLFLFFQMNFAAITVALMVGAFIERMNFKAWIIISILWTLLVYVPVAHWIWGGGWLGSLGTLDFAGGLVVHETCGIGALVGALVLGKRLEPVMKPSNLPLAAIGAGLLWFGWFGFNGGSALAINAQAVSASLITTLAAIMGGLTWMFAEWIKFKKPTTLGLITGFIAGLATITPAAGFVDVFAGIIIGSLGGLLCFWAVVSLKAKFKYDDSLDVWGVHGVGGILGALLLAIFAKQSVGGVNGLISGDISLLVPQIIGVVAVGVYTALITFIIFKITDSLVGLKVSKDEERMGIDESTHGEKAYLDIV
ncbi:MAG: ammonia channel protein [Hydrogenothermus sp.]|nr:MAG: ammonia channel protein [Hydrogenothermus sp.]